MHEWNTHRNPKLVLLPWLPEQRTFLYSTVCTVAATCHCTLLMITSLWTFPFGGWNILKNSKRSTWIWQVVHLFFTNALLFCRRSHKCVANSRACSRFFFLFDRQLCHNIVIVRVNARVFSTVTKRYDKKLLNVGFSAKPVNLFSSVTRWSPTKFDWQINFSYLWIYEEFWY